jgi:hypothetical protein
VYTAPLAHAARLRSAGVTDLRYGYLLESEWQNFNRFAADGDRREGLPLPTGVACFTVAARLAGARGKALGDGMVPVDSALGIHAESALALAFSPAHQCVVEELSHLGLLGDKRVYAQLLEWLSANSRVLTAPA